MDIEEAKNKIRDVFNEFRGTEEEGYEDGVYSSDDGECAQWARSRLGTITSLSNEILAELEGTQVRLEELEGLLEETVLALGMTRMSGNQLTVYNRICSYLYGERRRLNKDKGKKRESRE